MPPVGDPPVNSERIPHELLDSSQAGTARRAGPEHPGA